MSSDTELELLWRNVVDAWDDKSSHELLLQSCLHANRLGFAAGKYRKLAEAPDSPPQIRQDAEKRLAAIVLLATQSMEAVRYDRPRPNHRTLVVASGIMLLLALAWLAYSMVR